MPTPFSRALAFIFLECVHEVLLLAPKPIIVSMFVRGKQTRKRRLGAGGWRGENLVCFWLLARYSVVFPMSRLYESELEKFVSCLCEFWVDFCLSKRYLAC